MCGNMSPLAVGDGGSGFGCDVPVVELSVVLLAKFSPSGLCGGNGCSRASRSSVSAATIPPIEWPIRIVWTEGSMVGEGV